MRIAYIDEAGTSGTEPITVMAAVLVRPGQDEVRARQALWSLVRRRVPHKYRPGFVFHAAELANARNWDNRIWSAADRQQFLDDVIRLPHMLSLPITLIMVRRMIGQTAGKQSSLQKQAVFDDHAEAFKLLVGEIDRFLQTRGAPNERATLTCEDHPTMKRSLLEKLTRLRSHPEMARYELRGNAGAARVQEHLVSAARIDDPTLFLPKDGHPLLQLADGCAYAFKRYVNQFPNGNRLMTAMVGAPPPIADFQFRRALESYWIKEVEYGGIHHPALSPSTHS